MERFQVPFGQGTLANNWKNPHEGVESCPFWSHNFPSKKFFFVNRESPLFEPRWTSQLKGEIFTTVAGWWFQRFFLKILTWEDDPICEFVYFSRGLVNSTTNFLYVIYPMCPEKKHGLSSRIGKWRFTFLALYLFNSMGVQKTLWDQLT